MKTPFLAPWLPVDQWLPCTAPFTCGSACRSAHNLNLVIDQFEVETAQRYASSRGATWCNVFLSDVTSALACEIPRVWHGREMTANHMSQWLFVSGPSFGWTEVAPVEAIDRANYGFPTVAVWPNPTGHGHVAVVVPGGDKEIVIAQAGIHNFRRGPRVRGFGARAFSCFTHD